MVTDLAALEPAERQLAAQDLARAEPDLTGAELAGKYGYSERWWRDQKKAARTGTPGANATARFKGNGTASGVSSVPARPNGTNGTSPAERPSDNGTVPARSPRAGRAGRAATATGGTLQRAVWEERATRAGIAVCLAVVVAAPLLVSFSSLAAWGRDELQLGYLGWVVPFTLDAAAFTCVLLTFDAMQRADSAGAARLLVWVFAAASAVANWRHGTTISPAAEVYLPGMPLVAALLLDIAQRWVRRNRLAQIGALEPALPRFRFWRWAIAPIETFRAWRHAVRNGITDPAEAIAAVRNDKHRNGGDQP